MAYLDEMALEREKSRQALLAGKQPLMGADTQTALHALGVNLGVIPPNTPPSQMTQLLADLIKGPGKVKVDEQKPLQMPQQQPGHLMASLQPAHAPDNDIASALSNAMKGAKDSALDRMLRDQQAVKPPGGPAAPAAPAAPGANRARLSGNTPLAKANDLAGVDPKVAQAAKEWAQLYNEKNGPHSVQFTSGKREGDPREHGRGNAFDMQLVDKSTGKALENYRTNDPKTFAAYQEYANGFHQFLEANHPDLAARHRWGGYFSGDRSVYGSLDQMHHDFAGDRIGMAGGSWKDGLSPQQAKNFPGLTPGGGLAGKPPMAPGRPTLAAPSAPSAPSATPSAPSATTPGTPANTTAPSATGNKVLAEQRKPIAQFFEGNPRLKEQMAAAAYTEDNNSPEGRIAVHEAGANRINAAGRPVGDIIDPKYYAAMNDPAQRPKYEAALKRVQTDPQFKAMLYAEMDQAHKQGTNYAKLATDFGSGNTAAQSKTNSTQTAQVGGNSFFIKDRNPETHGAGTVAANQKWRDATTAAIKGQSTAPAQPSPQPAPQASAQPAPQAEAKPAQAATPAAASQPSVPPPGAAQLAAAEPEQLQPENPQPSPQPAPAVPPPVAAAATAPVPAPAAAPPVPPPAAKPAPPAAPPVNPAHAVLDTKVIDLVRRGDPSKVSQVPDMIGNKTLREALNIPFVGSQVAAGVKPYLGKMGLTQQQFDAAVKEGPPKPTALGKRSDLGTSGATDFSASRRLAPAAAAAGADVTEEATPAADQKPGATAAADAPTLDPATQPAYMDPSNREISTVRTMGIAEDGRRVNIPTVPQEGGRLMTDDEARQRYKETGNHLGKFDTREQSDAAAEALHQNEAAQIDTRDKGPQPATAPPAPQPQISPEMAKALNDAYKDQSRAPIDPPNPAAQPVLPAEPLGGMPGAPGAPGGGLSLAPAGLSAIPTGTLAPGAPASQGGSIALAGVLPPIQNATFSSPLIDQTAASTGSGMGLSPIPLQTLNGWGWGGGGVGSIGAGLDWGGGGFDFSPMGGTGGW